MADQWVSSQTNKYDNLVANYNVMPVVKEITLESGQNLKRGALLGKKTRSLGATAANGGNTGNGTLSNVAMKKNTKVGVYTVLFTAATVFHVLDPEGIRLKDGALGTNYDTDSIKFDSSAGGNAFVAGDKFTITIAAGSEKYISSLAAAVDGSQEPFAILAEDKDASSEDKTTTAYVRGQFNQEAITYGTGHTASSVKSGLEAKNIFLLEVIKQ